MIKFEHLLNWTLKRGSHPFPGKSGGTCINEAAIVAAGFPYQAVHFVESMPDYFSRPICSLAMQLNDEATDNERQKLMPFVTRLACADTPEIEQERESYIASRLRYCQSFQERLRILEGALAIGRQADLLEPEKARFRLVQAQRDAETSTSVAEHPLLSKVQAWLAPVF